MRAARNSKSRHAWETVEFDAVKHGIYRSFSTCPQCLRIVRESQLEDPLRQPPGLLPRSNDGVDIEFSVTL